jgi:hypothetical protein
MTLAPHLPGVYLTQIPDPPNFHLEENWLGSKKRWALFADDEQICRTVYESRNMALRHLDKFELNWWRAWRRSELERAQMLADMDAAEARQARSAERIKHLFRSELPGIPDEVAATSLAAEWAVEHADAEAGAVRTLDDFPTAADAARWLHASKGE